ncbi:hypothetical protein PSEUDT2_04450 [Stutzerimonas stutzeri]|nr:hypothetical protein PSEUDT2_04450 [Stutzerimonas stutzeri]
MDEDTFVLKAIEILQRKIDRLSSDGVADHQNTAATYSRGARRITQSGEFMS